MFSSRVGTVDIVLDYGACSQQGDPVQFIVDQALTELSLKNEYSAEEVEFVKGDAVLKDSARKAYLHVRKVHHRVPFDTYKAQRSQKEYVPPPQTHRLSLHYTRPHSRKWLDREV